MRANVRLGRLEQDVLGCRDCSLHETRDQVVFSRGNPRAELGIVGEAPGAEEDSTGLPFTGRSGKLLDSMLIKAGVEPNQVYIFNSLKCRPPNNRVPTAAELKACSGFFRAQIAFLSPLVLISMGKTAARALGVELPDFGWRGTQFSYGDIPVIVTFHPAYCLRNPTSTDYVVEDLVKAKDLVVLRRQLKG